MILFIKKVKIKLEWDNCIERKSKYESRFPANESDEWQIQKENNWKKQNINWLQSVWSITCVNSK
jgi:hypothetical protein